MVSLRGDQATEQAASLAYDILMKKQDLITMSSKEIAPEVLQVLERLPVGGVSEPVLQKSRSDGSNVYRLFCVVEHKPDTPPPFENVSSQLQNLLIQKLGDQQREEYFAKLRKRFCCEDLVATQMFPASYQPFTYSGS